MRWSTAANKGSDELVPVVSVNETVVVEVSVVGAAVNGIPNQEVAIADQAVVVNVGRARFPLDLEGTQVRGYDPVAVPIDVARRLEEVGAVH